MPQGRLTGSRIREKRLDQALRQSAVAEAVGISPSYLNLIEHNRRRIGGKLLHDLARVLNVDPSQLTEGVDNALLDQMRAAAAAFGETAEIARTEEVAARFPGWAGLIAAQSRRLSVLEDRVQTLIDRMAYDPQLATSLHEVISAVTAIRSSASILVGQEELDADWQRRFHENIHNDSRRLADSSEALIAYLEAPQVDASVVTSPMEDVEAYFAVQDGHISALEAEDVDLDAFVAEAGLTGAARKLLRITAETYHRDAVALPRVAFEAASVALGYDPVMLSARFSVDFDVILRRLATLSRQDGHPPMGLAVCDASGTLTFLKHVPGFALSRFGGACPLWPIFRAMGQPGRPVRADVVLPGAVPTQLRCFAVARAVGQVQFDVPPALQSTMLVLPDPPEVATDPLQVGVSCRICPRLRCSSRREPSIDGDALQAL